MSVPRFSGKVIRALQKAMALYEATMMAENPLWRSQRERGDFEAARAWLEKKERDRHKES